MNKYEEALKRCGIDVNDEAKEDIQKLVEGCNKAELFDLISEHFYISLEDFGEGNFKIRVQAKNSCYWNAALNRIEKDKEKAKELFGKVFKDEEDEEDEE